MNDIIRRGAEAMRGKRVELIARPLDRIWPELTRTAVEAMREPTPAMIAVSAAGFPATVWGEMIDEALKVQP